MNLEPKFPCKCGHWNTSHLWVNRKGGGSIYGSCWNLPEVCECRDFKECSNLEYLEQLYDKHLQTL